MAVQEHGHSRGDSEQSHRGADYGRAKATAPQRNGGSCAEALRPPFPAHRSAFKLVRWSRMSTLSTFACRLAPQIIKNIEKSRDVAQSTPQKRKTNRSAVTYRGDREETDPEFRALERKLVLSLKVRMRTDILNTNWSGRVPRCGSRSNHQWHGVEERLNVS